MKIDGLEKTYLSFSKDIINEWADEALKYELFRKDGVAQFIFRDINKIDCMIYLPKIAWVMKASFSNSSVYQHRWQAFTKEDMRKQGICTYLYRKALQDHNATIKRHPNR